MSQTIYVPEDDDEAVMMLLPSLWRLARGHQQSNRAERDTDEN